MHVVPAGHSAVFPNLDLLSAFGKVYSLLMAIKGILVSVFETGAYKYYWLHPQLNISDGFFPCFSFRHNVC